MTLPVEQTTSLPELPAAESISGTDLLLITRTGASLKAAASLLLAYIVEHFDLSAFATLSSPALTGTPTGPTADPDTDTEQLATTAFVQAAKSALLEAISALTAGSVGADPAGTASSAITAHNDATDPHGDRAFATSAIATAIANLVATAPTTLDTLNELAAALGNDPNFAATIATALGYRVRFDAPQTLTGPQKAQARDNIGAETAGAAASVQSTLQAAIGGLNAASVGAEPAGAAASAVNGHSSAPDPHGDRSYTDTAVSDALKMRNLTKTASYQLQASDGDGKTALRMNVATAHNVTIPTAATEAIPVDRPILVKWVGVGKPSLVTTGLTVNGSTEFSAQGEAKMLVRIEADTWDIYGA